MVAPVNDPKPEDDGPRDEGEPRPRPDIKEIIERVLAAETRLYEASEELVANGIAKLAARGWAETLGTEGLFELSYKIRASVDDGKTPADCNHVAIELYRDGEYIGAAWAWFERGTLAGQPLSDEQLSFLKTHIVESDDYEVVTD